ncbi:MAG: threonine--tRNA ligase [Patescibacteria group bacterium]|jgi:threonyl-tRNA synthetase|nr:threonine--tRNA ligase [Patescibacteria group bacterium]
MSDKNVETMRHSLSHVMAAAVLEMFPEAKLAIGPAIENGFYYDFDLPRTLIPEDLPLIEEKMKAIVKKGYTFEKAEIPAIEALQETKKNNQIYKADLIQDLMNQGEKTVSFYRMNSFTDLCKGPHVKTTKEIGAFKLTSIAGAYWRGNEKNKMLQRIYGVAFPTQKELETYLEMLEEAKKRDHKRLGPDLGLFMFHETAPGMPYWLPNGVIILNELINFWRVEHTERNYVEIKTPLINKKELYEISGHWDHYQEEMFISKTENKEIYALKPMNCPNAMVVFGSKKRSYRELPMRLGDTDTLHRNERSGTLNGLLRAREFSQDDAHIFVAESQIKDEYRNIFEIVERFYSIFGLDYSFRLGTRPDKYMGDKKIWDKAEKELKEILVESKKPFTILEGDGAFYGPKIDILMKDSLGREWQMGTIQLDFQIPLRFNLTYTNEEGKEKTPVVIHRVIYGSLERFMGILVEHTAGAFPLWLSPVQVRLIPVSDKFIKFSERIEKQFREENIRVEIDKDTESVGKKIRNAELMKTPYMIVVGEKEEKSGLLPIRSYLKGDLGNLKLDKFIEKIKKEINDKK